MPIRPVASRRRPPWIEICQAWVVLSSLLWVFSVVFLVIGPWAVASVRECVSGPRAVLLVLRQPVWLAIEKKK